MGRLHCENRGHRKRQYQGASRGIFEVHKFQGGRECKKGRPPFCNRPSPVRSGIASAEAELAEAKARVELAKTNLERAKELYAADVVAK